MKQFKNFKLGTKIMALPMIVALFLLLAGLMTCYQLGLVGNHAQHTSIMAKEIQVTTGLLQDILQKDVTVQTYLRTGDAALVERFHTLTAHSETLRADARQFVKDSRHLALIDGIARLDATYAEVFVSDVVSHTQKRLKIADDLLNNKGPLVAKQLTDIIETAFSEEAVVVANSGGETLKHFLLARVYLLKYLVDNEEVDAERVRLELLLAENGFDEMREVLSQGRRQQWAQAAWDTMQAYNRGFEAIVQAITARNAAVQTRLRPLGEQIADAALGFQQAVWTQFEAGSREVETRISQTTVMVIGVTLIAIAIGLVLALVVTRNIVRPLKHVVAVSEAIAEGDLSTTIDDASTDEVGQLMQAVRTMTTKLRHMVSDILAASSNSSVAASEISQGNTHLSRRTQELAASLEQTVASLEEITSTVQQNADNAQQVNQLAAAAREQAEKGGDIVGRAVDAMREINSSSKQIADIIAVIDGIAFQTNLLALNAAVEAARAGEQGRGFAVVAAEVRNLAQRSAVAAKEIRSLIMYSVEKIEGGSKLVDATGKTLQDLVAAVKQVSELIAEMAAASQEQACGIAQINKAVAQMDEATQQNAALVEETAAASESLDDQARDLQHLMAFFRIDHRPDNRAADTHPARARVALAAPGQATSAPVLMNPHRGDRHPVGVGASDADTDDWRDL